MLPEEAARLDEVDEPYAEEPRTAEVPGRVAAAEARAAVETEREAAGTVRVAEEAERLTVGAEPAAEGVVRDAAAMRPEALAAEPEAAAAVAVPEGLPVPVRTTRPTPLRGLDEMNVSFSPLVARLWPWYLGAK